MRATEVLKLEHQVIVHVLDCLDRMTDNPQDLDREAATEVLEFLVDYADRRHHGKEEDLIFKAMAACGMPTEMGPIGVMLAEHVTGRAAISAMRLALALETSEGNERFAVSAMEYVVLLHEHIQKEDHILYPMAMQFIREPEVWADAKRRCDEIGYFSTGC